MSEPLWSPGEAAIEASQLTAFTRYAAAHTGLAFADYQALHKWSVTDPATFWSLFWDFTDIKAATPAASPVENLGSFPGANWFPGAELNFAENLLRENSDKVAFVSIMENGTRRECTYHDLHEQTAHIAGGLRELGLEAGDRALSVLEPAL